jgi:K+-transporting ATPase c subunit
MASIILGGCPYPAGLTSVGRFAANRAANGSQLSGANGRVLGADDLKRLIIFVALKTN